MSKSKYNIISIIKKFPKFFVFTHIGRFIIVLILLPVFEYFRDNSQNDMISTVCGYLSIISIAFMLLYALSFITYTFIIKPFLLRKRDKIAEYELKNKYK